MKGIYLINDRIRLNGLSKEDSIKLQEQTILPYIQMHKIEVVKLNPYQIYDYYTIPHALLHDLKKQRIYLDCFIQYSPLVMEDFINSYPARWFILKSFFKEVITIEEKDLPVKHIV
ncbi:hypothetical protein [Neobacillus niacini]|uniref:hypothetical protein n=1 Tax=Neobacillus niacini TaxID=86668 RepID=UPI0005EF6779|nr:hypothetical protein [Neobacillus niacini]